RDCDARSARDSSSPDRPAAARGRLLAPRARPVKGSKPRHQYGVALKSPFTRKTLSFLRALKRHNHREWIRERKPDYEQHVRAPMIDLLAQLAADLPQFAPELVSDPR